MPSASVRSKEHSARDLRVAVWGLGHHAMNRIIPALTAAPGLELHGACSRNAASVATAAASAADCRGWTNPDEMLASEAVDVVYVSTPIALHADQVRRVLLAGKHAWCEKPLSTSLVDTTDLVALSRERALTICEGFMYLYHPHFRYLTEVLASDRLGHVHSVICRFGIPPLERPGFRDDPALGGGAFLDVGCYPVSAAEALFRGAEPEIVLAEIKSEGGSAVDTAGRAQLRYAKGVSVTLEWRTRSSYRNEIDLWGTTGSLTTTRLFSKEPDYVPEFRWSDVRGAARVELGEANNHFVSMFRAFRRNVDDATSAEAERCGILRRAALSDAIRQHSTRQEA